MLIRSATPDDAAACAAIYAPYVTDTAISFETEAPTAAEMAERIAASIAWFVLEDDGRDRRLRLRRPASTRAPRTAGRARSASTWSPAGAAPAPAERSMTSSSATSPSAATATAIAGMTLPNPASEGLHRSLGFEPVGTYRDIGYKAGAWHDVAWTQRVLARGEDPPAGPLRQGVVVDSVNVSVLP